MVAEPHKQSEIELNCGTERGEILQTEEDLELCDWSISAGM